MKVMVPGLFQLIHLKIKKKKFEFIKLSFIFVFRILFCVAVKQSSLKIYSHNPFAFQRSLRPSAICDGFFNFYNYDFIIFIALR